MAIRGRNISSLRRRGGMLTDATRSPHNPIDQLWDLPALDYRLVCSRRDTALDSDLALQKLVREVTDGSPG